jgi:hypothetical protein
MLFLLIYNKEIRFFFKFFCLRQALNKIKKEEEWFEKFNYMSYNVVLN